jgi:hypothetical protein
MKNPLQVMGGKGVDLMKRNSIRFDLLKQIEGFAAT